MFDLFQQSDKKQSHSMFMNARFWNSKLVKLQRLGKKNNE